MDSLRKRNGARYSLQAARKRVRAAEQHMSPDYHYQAMALTYRRPASAMMQRTPRTQHPSRRAVEAASQRPTKRVHFAPLEGDVADAILSEPIRNDPLLAFPTDHSDQDVPRVPDEYNFKEHLPQFFPHGLPPSSLEAGATDQQYPPSYLFPDPPVGDGSELLLETPLRAVSIFKTRSRMFWS